MSDMLVKLYELPSLDPLIKGIRDQGIEIRRAMAPEMHIIVDWVERNFSKAWADECVIAISRQPSACYIAIENSRIVGFACYHSPFNGFFGPTGVEPNSRKRGIGKILLLTCLHEMYRMNYAYAIIGSAGPKEYYKKIVGAVEIENSDPGMFEGMLG